MLVKQAANVIELIEFFARHQRPATMAEISDMLNWPRSSTFNLVGTLVEKGYLYEPRGRGGYYPSPRWMSTIHIIAEADPLPPQLMEASASIRDRTGETTAIGHAIGTDVIFLHVCESDQPIRYFAQIGTRVPVHASSAGRAILSHFSRQERNAIYRRIVFTHYSQTTPMNIDAVEAELEEARIRGFHQSNSEFIADLAGVAIPLLIDHRRLSLVVAGPTSRCLARRAEIASIMLDEIRQRGLGANPARGLPP